ncbi:MAG: hypothetical protein QS721_10020 [Candidatus Endonucleobacter sp. (ex Gigantidas childressi)]|nr:hypothetical protein [Candidatus Endonucleobacter sp. (ex Gigantidas childressi)]
MKKGLCVFCVFFVFCPSVSFGVDLFNYFFDIHKIKNSMFLCFNVEHDCVIQYNDKYGGTKTAFNLLVRKYHPENHALTEPFGLSSFKSTVSNSCTEAYLLLEPTRGNIFHYKLLTVDEEVDYECGVDNKHKNLNLYDFQWKRDTQNQSSVETLRLCKSKLKDPMDFYLMESKKCFESFSDYKYYHLYENQHNKILYLKYTYANSFICYRKAYFLVDYYNKHDHVDADLDLSNLTL